ncbi:MAG: hypothetical protein FD123_780 [Bacteroidetes bacterium]|nr:MAG: hypothetical protein FD123_780 [Bacteroidota bacterium]
MGAAIECCMNWFWRLEPSDWIEIFGILINAGLAIWIVITIQNRLTNKRVLKDYFISEVKDLRNEYKICLSNLYTGKTYPKSVTPWFKLMNIKVNDLMKILQEQYKIDKDILKPYQNDLRELITEDENFIKQFKNDKPIEFNDSSKNSFMKFQQQNNSLFNKLIISINEAK